VIQPALYKNRDLNEFCGGRGWSRSHKNAQIDSDLPAAKKRDQLIQREDEAILSGRADCRGRALQHWYHGETFSVAKIAA
jgi:hypothetical protein